MMRPYRELGCGSCGVAAGRGVGAILPLQHGMMEAGVMVPLGNVSLADTLLSPGAVRSAMDDVNDHVNHLMVDITSDQPTIQASAVGQRFFQDWIALHADWSAWYATRARATSWLTGPFTATGLAEYSDGQLVNDLRRRAALYNDLEDRYRAITGHTPTFNPTESGSQVLPTEAWVAIGIGAGVLALGFIAWTASSVSKVAAPAARALNGRKRRKR